MMGFTNNPFMQGMQAGQSMGSGLRAAMDGGTPIQLAMQRVQEGGEDPQAVFQELLQKDPQAAQQFATYMQQMNTNFGSTGQSPMVGAGNLSSLAGLFGLGG